MNQQGIVSHKELLQRLMCQGWSLWGDAALFGATLRASHHRHSFWLSGNLEPVERFQCIEVNVGVAMKKLSALAGKGDEVGLQDAIAYGDALDCFGDYRAVPGSPAASGCHCFFC